MVFFKSFSVCVYFKTFIFDWLKESIFWIWDFEEMKIKGRPTWLFWVIVIILFSAIGEHDFLRTQIWPWHIINMLIIPFLFLTLLTVCTKKYQEIDDLKDENADLKKQLDFREQKQELLSDLEIILNKYDDFHCTKSPHPMIYNEHPAYQEILVLLSNSKIVLSKILSCFKDGKLPAHLKNQRPNYTLLDNRWNIIDSIRNCDKDNFYSE